MATKRSFESGDGGELVSRSTRRAKMAALHSSSALGVNVFDYWTEKAERSPLAAALNLDAPISNVEFEVKYPTGLLGTSPNLDVVLRLQSGATVAIESKFTEWLTQKPPSKEFFKPKYFPTGEGLWDRKGLKQCQELAEDLANGKKMFRYLDAAQLLKHALGLWSSSDRASLLYVYYDFLGGESEQHRKEIDHFAGRVGSELGFRSLTYQELFVRLWEHGRNQHLDYLTYLLQRYFRSAGP